MLQTEEFPPEKVVRKLSPLQWKRMYIPGELLEESHSICTILHLFCIVLHLFTFSSLHIVRALLHIPPPLRNAFFVASHFFTTHWGIWLRALVFDRWHPTSNWKTTSHFEQAKLGDRYFESATSEMADIFHTQKIAHTIQKSVFEG